MLTQTSNTSTQNKQFWRIHSPALTEFNHNDMIDTGSDSWISFQNDQQDNSLMRIHRASRRHNGKYQCKATNTLGVQMSEPITLKFNCKSGCRSLRLPAHTHTSNSLSFPLSDAPECAHSNLQVVHIWPETDLFNFSCQTNSSPPANEFRWKVEQSVTNETFNWSDWTFADSSASSGEQVQLLTNKIVTSEDGKKRMQIAEFISRSSWLSTKGAPLTGSSQRTSLLCWGTNLAGKQSKPCRYLLVFPGS
jgi:hypothetical protein